MWSYAPPLEDIRFVIEDVIDAPASWSECPDHSELDASMARQVLDEAGQAVGRCRTGLLAPLGVCRQHRGHPGRDAGPGPPVSTSASRSPARSTVERSMATTVAGTSS